MINQRLLLSLKDRPGIVAEVSTMLAKHGANITGLDEHAEPAAGRFAMRIAFALPVEQQDVLASALHIWSKKEEGEIHLHAADRVPRVAILCSREDHCLADLLWRFDAGELRGRVVGVFATQPGHEAICSAYDVPLRHMPVGDGGMPVHEKELLEGLDGVDLVILARYMRILSEDFLERVNAPVINIHHSFLPAFIGANPYEEAHERGVKLIGATAHYAWPELDAGPIIEQDVVRVGHRQDPGQLRLMGRDVERVVLARAVKAHLEDRVVVWGNRTVVFS